MAEIPAAQRFPLVARIRGNNEVEGIEILRRAGIVALSSLKESAQSVVAAAQRDAPAGGPA
jgi:succinyl-CoA synthetase beta subunit